MAAALLEERLGPQSLKTKRSPFGVAALELILHCLHSIGLDNRLGRLRLDLYFLSEHKLGAGLGGRLLTGLDHEEAREDELASGTPIINSMP